jgi:hypothetical protein
VYAEAGKDFVDILMSVREHHLATINPSKTASSQEAREGTGTEREKELKIKPAHAPSKYGLSFQSL